MPVGGNHGTQVAGQVAGDGTDGIVTGMAPDAELMVLGINCSPPDSIGWEASDYAIAGALAGSVRGARQREAQNQRARAQAEAQAQAHARERLESFKKAFSACMQGKSYTVTM